MFCHDLGGFVPYTSRNARQFAASLITVSALSFALVGCADNAESSSGSSTSTWGDSSVRDKATLSGTVFDSSKVHSIEVTYDDAAYTEMLAAYNKDQSKEWIEATITIDGKTFKKAGLRLKGNSSLRSISLDTKGEDIPWLIRLDKFVDGQNLDGNTDFVIRSNTSDTALNEAVAQSLFAEAGLASQAAIAVRFSVNGSDDTLRLAVENPNDEWEDSQFDTEGILYKAEADGDYSYRGDKAEDYVDVFDQETNNKVENYEPLIEFLEFINDSDDDTFASDLSETFDVDAFASYLAMQDLIDNFDDIDGPGNNSYLRWNSEDKVFTVVNWDLNLAFGSMMGGMGGDGAGGRGNFDPNNLPEGVEMPEGFDPENMPEGMEPPEGMEMPEGFDPENMPAMPGGNDQDGQTSGQEGQAPAQDGNKQGGQGGPAGFGGMNGSNILKERFLEVEEFNAKYEQAQTDLREALYTSGKAQEILDQWSNVLKEGASDLVTDEQISTDAQAISKYFTQTQTDSTTQQGGMGGQQPGGNQKSQDDSQEPDPSQSSSENVSS